MDKDKKELMLKRAEEMKLRGKKNRRHIRFIKETNRFITKG